MTQEDWTKMNKESHYNSLIKQDLANRKLIRKLQLERDELKQQLRIGVVSKSFNSEDELLQFIYMHTPIAIKPKSKQAKGKLVSAFKSGNAFEQVCKHLAKKLFNVC